MAFISNLYFYFTCKFYFYAPECEAFLLCKITTKINFK